MWPVDIVRQLKRWADPPRANVRRYDPSKRLIAYPDKTEVACPALAETTAVILAIGQSNAANAAARKVATRYPDRVFNYFDGKCYVTASPLLGATSEGGEFLTLLADELIAAGTYRGVIIVAAAHDGSPVSRWRRNGDLNERLLSTLKALPPGYKVTEVVWHQGRAHDACRSLHGVVQLADRDPDGKRCGRPRLRRDRQQAHLPRRRNGRAPRPGRPARGQMPSQRKRADKDGCGLCAGHQGVSPVTLTLSGELFEARGDAPRAAWDTGLGAGTDDESVGRPKSRSGTAAI
ncbi:MAG: sialate O-acetylesterase [Alphaproteobacteria bacterium]